MKKIKSLSSVCIITALIGCVSSENKTVVAKVNGEDITASQLSERLNRTGESNLTPDGSIPDERKVKIVDHIVEEEIILQAALKDGLLKKSERLRREIMREYLQTKIADEKEPTESELKNYYEQYKKDLDKVHFRQILVKGGISDVALKTAKEILAKLKQDKTVQFEDLAAKYSDDENTKTKGGDMGSVRADQLTPEVVKALSGLQNLSDVSEITKTDSGYVIFQILEDRRGFEKNRIALQMNYSVFKSEKLTKELLEKLHKNASVTTYPKVIAKINPSVTN